MFLLRSRFRTIISSSKQSPPLMDQTEQNQSSFPRFFGGFFLSSISNTSILDTTTKQFCNSLNHIHSPFFGNHENVFFKPPSSSIRDISKDPYHEVQKGIGIVLEKQDFDRKLVVFGANLMMEAVKFPGGDYGIKTKNTQLNSPPCFRGKLLLEEGSLSLMEMEILEEYTCVMTHGPNPKTTHIFDDTTIVVEKTIENNNNVLAIKDDDATDFLGFCYNCKVKLVNGKDIYMYRGEKGFCSPECRLQEMVMEGGGGGHAKIFDEDYYY